MEKICLDNIISALLFLGFDKVDSLLISYTTKNILESDMYHFELDNDSLPSLYNYVELSSGTFKLNEQSIEKINHGFKENIKKILALHSNKRLIEYLKTVDFTDIVLLKLNSIGIKNALELNNLFSNKEKQIIMNIFDINVEKEEHLKK